MKRKRDTEPFDHPIDTIATDRRDKGLPLTWTLAARAGQGAAADLDPGPPLNPEHSNVVCALADLWWGGDGGATRTAGRRADDRAGVEHCDRKAERSECCEGERGVEQLLGAATYGGPVAVTRALAVSSCP
eukprot:15479410-Alexandrium_andersonii.AAC.1